MANLVTKGPIATDRALAIAAQVAAALRDRHARGAVHLGVRPAAVDVEEGAAGPVVTLREPDGCDPAYVAPEQWSGGVVGPPADVYATGALLWTLLRGAPPPEARSGPPAAPADLPAPIRDVLTSALAADPAARPDAGGLLAALLAAHAAVTAPAAASPHPRPRMIAAAVGGLLLVGSAGVVVVLRGVPGREGAASALAKDAVQAPAPASAPGDRPTQIRLTAGQDTGRAPEPMRPSDTGRAPEPERASDPARAAEPAPSSDPGRAAEPAQASDPGRAPEPMHESDPGRAAEPAHASDPGRAPESAHAIDPGRASEPTHASDPGRAPEPVHASDPGRAPEPVHENDPGRAPRPAHESEPGRTPSPTHESDTGRAQAPTHESDTGRTDEPASGASETGRVPTLPGTLWHVRPDGRKVQLVRVPGGPVIDDGARRRCETFFVESTPATHGDYATFLAAAAARGEALEPLLPGGEAGALLRRHVLEGAPLPEALGGAPVRDLPVGAAERWHRWCGLRPLSALERRRAAVTLNVPEDDLRGGASVP